MFTDGATEIPLLADYSINLRNCNEIQSLYGPRRFPNSFDCVNALVLIKYENQLNDAHFKLPRGRYTAIGSFFQ